MVSGLIAVTSRGRVGDDDIAGQRDRVPEIGEIGVRGGGGWVVVREGPVTATRGLGGAKDGELGMGSGGRGEADRGGGVVEIRDGRGGGEQ